MDHAFAETNEFYDHLKLKMDEQAKLNNQMFEVKTVD